jgi:hypothetical protein
MAIEPDMVFLSPPNEVYEIQGKADPTNGAIPSPTPIAAIIYVPISVLKAKLQTQNIILANNKGP